MSLSMRIRALLAVFLLGAILPAFAQQTLGGITGGVTDTTGAVVPKVTVKIVNISTGLVRTAVTSSHGAYQFTGLPAGTYTVTFTRNGFKTVHFSTVIVQANRTATVAAKLQPGAAGTTITVSGTPLLNQVDTTNGYILGSQTIQQIPLATGSFTQLAILSPGVNADLLTGSGTNEGLGNQSINANGQRDTSNSFTFNSVNANNIFNGKTSSDVGSNRYVLNTNENFLAGGQIQENTSVYDAIGQGMPTPPKETIQEMRVNTSMYDASQGANSGAHVDVSTMSGTNQLHGQVYGYRGSDWLNAAPFFFKTDPSIPANQKVPRLLRGVYGFTLGGPIVKNKLFYFGSYQATRVHDQMNGFSPVVVPFNLTNDRSAATLGTTYGINPSSINPVALKILNAKGPNGQYLIPTPTITDPNLANSLGHDAVVQGPPSTFNADQVNANLDYNVNNSDLLSSKYYFQNDPSYSPFAVSQTIGFGQHLRAGAQVYSLDNVKILTPNLTWEQKLGFIRETAYATTDQSLTPSDIGINLFGSSHFPGLYIRQADPTGTAYGSLSFGPDSNFSNAGIYQNQYEFSTNLNWVTGRHTLSFGMEWDHNHLNVINKANDVASLSFNSFPAFLQGQLRLGEDNSVMFAGASSRHYVSNQLGGYAQDKFQVTRNLVLTLGVRYDYDGPLSEINGLMVNFDPSKYQYNAATDTIVNDGIIVSGNNSQYHTPGASASTLTGRQWGIAPRVGFAWSPSFMKNFVVRSGFGIYYDRGEFFTEFSPSAGFGFNGPFGVTLQPPFVLPVLSTSADNLSNPFGTTAPTQPNGNPSQLAALLPNIAQLISGNYPAGNQFGPYLFGGYDPSNTLPYSENWSLDLQWQPVNTLVMTAAYIGNRGLHEVLPIPFNQPGIATPSSPINGQIYSYGYNVPGLSTESINTIDGGNTDLRVPYVGYSPNSVLYKAEGVSYYNSLQLGLTKRISHGLQVGLAYTWSHSLDEGSGLGLFYNGNDPLNPRTGYGSSDFDRTHVFTANYYYQIPGFGGGKGFAGKLLSGWGITGVTVLESGQPYNVYDFSGGIASIYYSTNDFITNPIVPLASGYTPGSALTGASGANPNDPALNPNAFTVPYIAPGTGGVPPCENVSGKMICDIYETGYGNGHRNIFRGPFQARADLSLFKNTQLNERFQLNYSLDVFNLTNTTSFDTPNNNVSFNPYYGNPPEGPNGVGYQFPPSGELGVIQHTIGSPRQVQMSLHLVF